MAGDNDDMDDAEAMLALRREAKRVGGSLAERLELERRVETRSDGRHLRAGKKPAWGSGRVLRQMNLRVTQESKDDIFTIARETGLTYGEIIETGIKLFKIDLKRRQA